MGSKLTFEEAKKEIYGRNEELIERIFPNKYTLQERFNLGVKKEATYRKRYESEVMLISGLHAFLKQAKSNNLKLAIGSAAIYENISFVFDHVDDLHHLFDCIVSGEDVSRSKPDPEVFLKCAKILDVEPKKCLVFEDVPKGVEAAVRAGMASVVIKTSHQERDFVDFEKHIIGYLSDYT